MAIKISELNELTELTIADVFPIVDNNETKKTSIDTLTKYITSKITVLTTKVVDNVSAVTEENILYLVPNSTSGDNKYDEYMLINDSKEDDMIIKEMLINGSPELIGSQTIDLSDYPTTEEMNTAISNAIGGALNGTY